MDTQPHRCNQEACAMEVHLTEFDFRVVRCARITHQAADALSRLPTKIADDTPLGDDVLTTLIVNDAAPDTAYMCCHLTCEEEGVLDLALRLVASLEKKPSYGQPQRLKEFVKSQSMNAYCKQVAGALGIPGSVFSLDCSGILIPVSAVNNAI